MSPDPAGEGWERFHPLSPLLRGGLVLVAVLGWFVSTLADDLLGSFGDRPSPEQAPGSTYEVSALDHPLVTLAVVALAILGACLLGVASWWFTRYRLGPSTIEVRRGFVARQHRQIRYSQIQAVNTLQPLLARLVGLAEVRVESAGGGDSHVSLAYLTRADAEGLRERIVGLAEAAGAGPAPQDPTTGDEGGALPERDGAPAATLLRMPLTRLVGSIVLSVGTIVAAVMVLVAGALVWRFGTVAVTGLLPPLLLSLVGSVRQLLTWANLVVRRQGDTLRSQHGLTSLASSTVPVRRVQAVEIVQPWLWRRAGWWRLSVNIAGVKVGGEGVVDDGVLVPAATRAEAGALLDLLSPATDSTPAMLVMDHGLPPEAVRCPPQSRWFDPWSWRYRGVLLADEIAVIRSGRLARTVTLVPWGRIQSVTVSQGALERRLGLASIDLVSTVGAVHPSAQHLAVADAEQLAEEVRRRAGRARLEGRSTGQAPPEAPDVVGLDR